ncbi:hypothetical protein B0H11DRAFT_2220510 [Mycena galericulata]|nr:hypothetical protein B0H11DRAFT_2220510 [Mycena galericulata]
MISESAHLSRTSVDSTTALTASYRPPQKDFAAALATLQDAYGTHSVGQSLPTLPTIQSKTPYAQAKRTPASGPEGTTAPADIQPSDTSASAGEAGLKAMSKRLLKAMGLTFMKVIGMAEKSSAAKGEGFHPDTS